MKGRTWDVQLALALLDATVGTGLAGALLIRDIKSVADRFLDGTVFLSKYLSLVPI